MSSTSDLLIVGAGPAGCAAAILMSRAGWQVTLMERDLFPRQKVCGECVAGGNLELLDALGAGPEFRRLAGPELRQAGWLRAHQVARADMPRCDSTEYRFGRAIGRDRFDAMLLDQARAAGATVLQPATAVAITGAPGRFRCEYSSGRPHDGTPSRAHATHSAAVVMDAHGSWDRGPRFGAQAGTREPPRCDSDLFAFKARFLRSALEPGFLPVLAIDGGYGGMVVSDNDRTTVACCVRRDVLRRHRQSAPGASAGSTMEVLLRRSCNEVRRLLDGAERDGPWLSVGPIRPGLRLRPDDPLFRIGNAAGETHPLTGEGISMALQSAALLASELRQIPPDAMTPGRHAEIQHRYNSAWRRAFGRRLLVAGGYAQIAMHPLVSRQVGALFHRWPQLLTQAASWAGKARSGYLVSYPNSVTP